MVERLSVVKVDAASVQGEGAYVLWRRMTWGERKAYMQSAKDNSMDILALLVDHIAGWNWVDVNGEPLEAPKHPDDLEHLYEEEIVFLANIATRAMHGRLELTAEAEKN